MSDHSENTRRPDSFAPGSEATKDFLLTLNDRLRGTDSASEVKAVAVEMLQQYFGTERVGYREMDESSETVRDLQGPYPALSLKAFGPAFARDLHAGRTVVVTDRRTDPRAQDEEVVAIWEAHQMRSGIATPLIRNGRLVAVLFILAPEPRAWSPADVQLMEGVATRTWEAVERARAETALRQSEERLREIADAMPALIAYFDADLHYRFINQLYCEWFDRPRAEILGRHLRDVMGPATFEAHRPWLERAQAGERVSYEVDFRGIPPRHTVAQHVPHFDAEGRVIGIYSLVQDVTVQKRVQEQLRESRDEFAAVLDAVPAGIIIATDPKARAARINRAAANMLGLTVEGDRPRKLSEILEGKRMFDAEGRELGPEDNAVARAARGEISSMHEERIVFKNGTVLNILGNAGPLRNLNGEIRGAVGAFIDIGERKRAEDALREESRTLETVNRIGAALAAELDLDRLVQLITDAGVEVTGATFGAFFYHAAKGGDHITPSTVSGILRQDFEVFGAPLAKRLFQPRKAGDRITRSDDLFTDPQFRADVPPEELPKGHGPIRSYLAVPVISRTGAIIGSLLFGHPQPRRFSDRHERLMAGIAAQAAIAIDNAHLYREAQLEIEQRKRAEGHQRLLIAELNHRVKNTLAIVQGVAQQTFRESSDMDEARSAFEGRLAALSSAHNVLTRRNWEHAHFTEIVEEALAAFHPADDGRAVVAGIDMQVEPKTAVSLGMAFHELGTNAVKYGAWSNSTGRVIVEWRVPETKDGPRLQLVWREEGGPPVTAPRRKGFGSRMVERALAAELGGTVTLVYDETGIRCEIDAPLPSRARLHSEETQR